MLTMVISMLTMVISSIVVTKVVLIANANLRRKYNTKTMLLNLSFEEPMSYLQELLSELSGKVM